MRKSMIVAAVAATVIGSAANAAFFSIAGASYNPGSIALVPGAFNMANSTTDFSANTTGAANTISVLNAADITALNGISTSADTVTYFSYQDGGGLGYFGVIINTSVTRVLDVNFLGSGGNGATGGTKGAMWSETSVTGSVSATGENLIINAESFSAGTHYIVFGGLSVNSGFTGAVVNDSTETGNFGIAYLSWNGASWSTMASLASGATGSSVSVATYSVPVPAPALLAGAGLVGAAALRRRMAKKA